MIGGRPSPPRLAAAILRRLAPEDRVADMLGDLEEELRQRAQRDIGRPRLWYWRQVLQSLPPIVLVRLRALRHRHRGRERRRRGDGMMSELVQDLRYALRTMRLAPGFAATVILTLGLGIAANAVIFSIVDGLILNPFPYPEPQRLVGIGTAYPRLNRPLGFWEVLSPAEFTEIEEAATTLERIVAWDMGHRQLSRGEAPENVFTAFWWGDALATLGMAPALGRGFLPEEIERREPVAILSYRLWSTRYAGDREIVGDTIFVNGQPYTVVGIMPARSLIYGTDLWIPMPVGPEVIPRHVRNFQILARLAPGVSLGAANAELATIAGRIEQEHGAAFEEYRGWSLEAATWNRVNARGARPAALVLVGAVGFVLLLVCVNVASLLLGRAARRHGEIALRRALGAGKRRLVRQLLTESVTLASCAGALGALLAYFAIRAFDASVNTLISIPMVPQIGLNLRVLLFVGAVSLGTGLLVGIVPALHASRSDLAGRLKASSTQAAGRSGARRLQKVFVGLEVALAMALLVGGGLLVNSFVRMLSVDPGFDARDLLTMRLTLPREEYEGVAISEFFHRLRDGVAPLPGVESAAVATQFPPLFLKAGQFTLEGGEATGEGALPSAFATLVDDRYFSTLGMRLVRGRNFLTADAFEAPRVGIVNAALADRYFPDQSPVGRRLKLGAPDDETEWIEIVGVVASVHNRGLDHDPGPELFLPLRQSEGLANQLYLLVRSELPAETLLPSIRKEVAALDADQPIYAVQTVEQAFAAAAAARVVATFAMLIFGTFALGLAAVGIYAVSSYAVSERAGEIGLRMAIGATRGQIVRWVVRQAMPPVLVGATLGLLLAAGLGRVLASLLFEVGALDPATLVTTTLFLTGIALLATYLPARRASGLDPVATLRSE